MQADLAVDAVGEADTPDIALACLHSLRRGGILVLDGSMKCPLPLPYGKLSFLSDQRNQGPANMRPVLQSPTGKASQSLTGKCGVAFGAQVAEAGAFGMREFLCKCCITLWGGCGHGRKGDKCTWRRARPGQGASDQGRLHG